MMRKQILLCSSFCCMLLGITCGSGDIQKGNVALELGDYSLAIRLFARCIEKDPSNFQARLGSGKAYLQQAADNPGDTVSWRDALMHLEAAHTLQENGEISRLLGQVWAKHGSDLLYRGDTLQALEALGRAVDVDNQNAEALNIAGIVYYKTGRPQKARLLFERAAGIDTNDVASVFNLGMLYWEEHRTAMARGLWLRALTLSPHDEDLLYWFAAAEKSLRDSAQINADSAGGQR